MLTIIIGSIIFTVIIPVIIAVVGYLIVLKMLKTIKNKIEKG